MTEPPTTPQSNSDDRDRSLGAVERPPQVIKDPAQSEQARAFAVEAARCLRDDKCENVVVLDLRGLSQVTDFFVIASGTSERQMRSAGQHVEDLGRDSHNMTAMHQNLRETDATWVVLDFVDVIVHVFEPETRMLYDLEMLWGDAPRVKWDDQE
jgi:ribosome-associated protein